MQETSIPSFNEHGGRNSRIEETEYEIGSNPTTPEKEQPNIPTVLPTLKTNIEAHQKTKKSKTKNSKYEPPVSDRETWWRCTIKDTPNPGTYDTHLNTFVKEILARQLTYGFKSDGRRLDPQPLEPKGKELLPGAYTIESFIERMRQLRFSYGFKGPEREGLLKKTMSFNQDKDIDVPPGLYETQKYQTIDVPVESIKHSFFKSRTQRRIFLPKIGPAPGDYEPHTHIITTNSPTVTSSFRSSTDRFHKKRSKVPGPGAYDKLTILPKTKRIVELSKRGIYFHADYTGVGPNSV